MGGEKTTTLGETGQRTTTLGAVLAGGAGRRLGGSKATAELAGRPLVAHALAALAEAGVEAVVVAKAETVLPPLEVPVVLESDEPRHPLLGIVTALQHAGGRPVLALACDLPLVPPALLAELAQAPQPLPAPLAGAPAPLATDPAPDPLVLAAPGGEPQPLRGRYSPQLLPDLEAALAREESLRRTVASLSPRLLGDAELARFGDPAELLLNVNDPADLARAGAILASR
jgi:molybdopterin-guanine dinucleotide biosynthesis protein A